MSHRVVLEGYKEISTILVNKYFRDIGNAELWICEHLFDSQAKISDIMVKSRGTIMQYCHLKSNEIKDQYGFNSEEEAENYIKRVKEGYWRANVKEFHFSEENTEFGDFMFDYLYADEISIALDTSSILAGILQKAFLTKQKENKIRELYILPMIVRELQNHAERRTRNKSGKDYSKKSSHLRNARLAFRGLNEIGWISEEFRECKLRMPNFEIKKSYPPDLEIVREAKEIQEKTEYPFLFLTNDYLQYTLAVICGVKAYCIPPFPKIDSEMKHNKEEIGRLLYEFALDFGQIEIRSPDVEIRLQSDWPHKYPFSWRDKRLKAEISEKDDGSNWDILREIINKSRKKYLKIEDTDPRFEFFYI